CPLLSRTLAPGSTTSFLAARRAEGAEFSSAPAMPASSPVPTIPWSATVFEYDFGTYGYSAAGPSARYPAMGLGLAGEDVITGLNSRPVRETEVAFPSSMIAMGDAPITVSDGTPSHPAIAAVGSSNLDHFW